MRRRSARAVVVVVVGVVVLTTVQLWTPGVSASPAAPASPTAVRPFGPPQTLVGGCDVESADSVTTDSGNIAGFAACRTASGLAIRFFSRTAAGTVNPSEPTGFGGRVLGVADDATASYVLFFTGTQIRIGKRTNTGAFSSRAVTGWSGVATPTGDVIALNGLWTAVWSAQVGPGGEFAQTELFEAASRLRPRRLTTTAANLDDDSPTLAFTGAIPTPVVIWSRTSSPAQPGPSDLMVKKRVRGVWEPDRIFANAGRDNGSPDMTIAANLTFVTWRRDGNIMVASNAGGSFTSRRFVTPGAGPRVAASTTAGNLDHLFVTWTTTAVGAERVFFGESATTGTVQGTWDGAAIAPVPSTAFGISAPATKATVVYGTGTSVAARSET
jgi:hypothetical protein